MRGYVFGWPHNISLCFLPPGRFAMRGVTQGSRSARSSSRQQCAHARLPHCVLSVVGADRMNTSPSVEARQLPGKILAAFLGGVWLAVGLHKVCARAQGWPLVVSALSIASACAVRVWANFAVGYVHASLMHSFLPASRLLSFVCLIVSTCRIMRCALLHGATGP